jgi:predicted protein tyrosine phosphatase
MLGEAAQTCQTGPTDTRYAMQWKYCLPAATPGNEERTALEDLFLLPEDGSSGNQSYWITLEGLQSFTGGTREEKLERLGDSEYVISDTMDMLVRRDDFSRKELLEWAKVFISARLGDPQPVLVEAVGDEVSRCVPIIHEHELNNRRAEKIHLLFVHHKAGPPAPTPEESLASHSSLEVQTVRIDEHATDALVPDMIQWADLLLVMDKRMRQVIHKRLKTLGITKRVICLYLPEHYDRQDPDYTALFTERVFVYLEKLGWKLA